MKGIGEKGGCGRKFVALETPKLETNSIRHQRKLIYCISVVLVQLVQALSNMQRQSTSFCSSVNPRKQICDNRFSMRIRNEYHRYFCSMKISFQYHFLQHFQNGLKFLKCYSIQCCLDTFTPKQNSSVARIQHQNTKPSCRCYTTFIFLQGGQEKQTGNYSPSKSKRSGKKAKQSPFLEKMKRKII